MTDSDPGFLPDPYSSHRRVHQGLAYRPEFSRKVRRFWRPEQALALAKATSAPDMAPFLFHLVEAPAFARLKESAVPADAYSAWINGDTRDVLSIMLTSYNVVNNRDLLGYVTAATRRLDATLTEIGMFGQPIGQDVTFDVWLNGPSERLQARGYGIAIRVFNSHRGAAAMRVTMAITHAQTGVALTGLPSTVRGERLPTTEWSFTHVSGLTDRIDRFVRYGRLAESADYLADLALRLDDIRADRELVSQMLHDMWPMPALPTFAREQPKDRRERYALVHGAYPDYGSLLDVVHAFAFYLDECSRLAGEASSTTQSDDLLIRRHRAIAMDRARSRKQAVWNTLMKSTHSEALGGVLTGHAPARLL